MKRCWYRTTRIGDGVSPTTAFRSLLNDIVTGAGERVKLIVHPDRAMRYAFVVAEEATLDTVDADSGITPISPRFDTDVDLDTWLGQRATSFPVAVLSQMEADGVDTSWIDASTTRAELLRYLTRVHIAAQVLDRPATSDAGQAFRIPLTDTIDDLTARQRNQLDSWMAERRIDRSGITGTTTMREVTRRISQDEQIGPIPVGRL